MAAREAEVGAAGGGGSRGHENRGGVGEGRQRRRERPEATLAAEAGRWRRHEAPRGAQTLVLPLHAEEERGLGVEWVGFGFIYVVGEE